MTFIETPTFTKRVLRLLDDGSYGELQTHLVNHPNAGDIIRSSGGLRKNPLGGQRSREARRCAGDLLLVDGQGSDFDAIHLPEKRNGRFECGTT